MANAWFWKPLDIVTAFASTAAKGTAENVGNDYAGMVWGSAVANSHAIVLDFGQDQTVDTLALFGFTTSTTVMISLQGATSAQGSGFGSPSYTMPGAPAFAGAARLPGGDGVSLLTITGWPPVRYLRIQFDLGSAAAVQFSRAAAGKRIVLERNFSMGGSFGVRDLGSLDFSARGVLLRRRGVKLRTLGLSFTSIRKDEVETMVKPLLERIGNTEMIVMVTDPTPHVQRENRSYYGPLVGDLSNVQRNSAAWEAKANLVSVF